MNFSSRYNYSVLESLVHHQPGMTNRTFFNRGGGCCLNTPNAHFQRGLWYATPALKTQFHSKGGGELWTFSSRHPPRGILILYTPYYFSDKQAYQKKGGLWAVRNTPNFAHFSLKGGCIELSLIPIYSSGNVRAVWLVNTRKHPPPAKITTWYSIFILQWINCRSEYPWCTNNSHACLAL